MLPLTPAVSQNLNTQHLLEPFAADYRNQLFDKKLLVKIPMSRLNNAKIEKSESKNLKETSKNCRNGEDKKNQTNDENEIGMNDEWIVNPSFVMALSLFRANIITLCLRCGIDGFALWPHEAILLNLDLLHSRCIQENESSILSTDKYKLKFKSGDINLFPTVFDELNSDNGCDDPLSGLIRRYKSKRIIKPLGAN